MRLHVLFAALLVGCGGAAETVTSEEVLPVDASTTVSDATVETAEGSVTPTFDATSPTDADDDEDAAPVSDAGACERGQHDGGCHGCHHHHHPGQVWHLHENRR